LECLQKNRSIQIHSWCRLNFVEKHLKMEQIRYTPNPSPAANMILLQPRKVERVIFIRSEMCQCSNLYLIETETN
jgi:hypothetical protein